MKELKWSEYCNEHSTDKLYFYDGYTFVTIAEGDGSNLDYEDEEAGYVDYWYAEVYTRDLGNCGGGLLLLKEYISAQNQTLTEIVKFLKKNKDAFDGIGTPILDCLIDPEEGEKLEEEFEEIEARKIAEAKARLKKEETR